MFPSLVIRDPASVANKSLNLILASLAWHNFVIVELDLN